MIDKDKLFQLFGSPEQKGDAQVLMNLERDFLEKPFAKIGMFTKLIVNNWVFHQKLQQFLSKEQPSYDIEDTKRASDFTVFNRAWHYIRQIDIDDEKHLQAIIEFKKDPFLSALVSALEYFQDPDIEQYERCAFLLKIIRLKKQV
tara:strand:- start:13213 stop:13647 length:435 start_codon:yes stop_codon:yes gene_type:complete